MQNAKEKIESLSRDFHPELIRIRQHLHRHPELSFEEKETSAFICRELDKLNIPYRSNVGGYGVIGMIEGPADGPVIALRADIDALPIQETNDVPYRSANPGKMHACGHDVHTTCLLGAARILQEMRPELPGSVKLIFQPAEEKLPGGASILIEEGVLENPSVQAIFGQHVHPPLEAGMVAFRPGIMMASADEIYITVKGRGGHAALQQDVIDTVLIASHIIVALQQVASRRSNPATPTVLSFGKVEAKGATNVIPSEVKIEGTFRTFDEAWRDEAHKIIRDIACKTAEAMGGSCDVHIPRGYPFLKNDEGLTLRSMDWAREYLGDDKVVEMPLRMTAEDFSFYTHHTDACFYRLGTGNKERGITSPVHTSTFDIDEAALVTGSGLMAWLAYRQLQVL